MRKGWTGPSQDLKRLTQIWKPVGSAHCRLEALLSPGEDPVHAHFSSTPGSLPVIENRGWQEGPSFPIYLCGNACIGMLETL